MTQTDYRKDFADFEDAAYLDIAAESPLPRSAIRAAQVALDWKKLPHTLPHSEYFGLPNRVRTSLARLLSADPDEVAITTGASAGLAAVAAGVAWKPEDEVLVVRGEFPAHFTAWQPLADAGRLRLIVVTPRGRFVTEDDLLSHLNRQTRLVSASLVRFDDASLLATRRLAETCRAMGVYLLLDISQCAGAMPLEVRSLGADFLVCAGYKWLLGPFGTGFFWLRKELLAELQPAPFYWMALEGADKFHTLALDRYEPSAAARRFDAPETSNFFNLSAWAASLDYLLEVGVETVWRHNQALVAQIVERLPRDRCLLASPAEPEARGPFVCVAARNPDRTAELHRKLAEARIFVSLRQGALRIAPYLYTAERDVARLLGVLSV